MLHFQTRLARMLQIARIVANQESEITLTKFNVTMMKF